MQPIICKRLNNNLFKTSHVFSYVGINLFKIQNRIGNNLSGTVESNISSPVYFEKAEIIFLPFFFSDQHMFDLSAFAKCIYRRVFHKKKVMGGLCISFDVHMNIGGFISRSEEHTSELQSLAY